MRGRAPLPLIAWGLVWPSHTVQLLRCVWCLLVFWVERGVFYRATSACDVPEHGASFRVLIISDPQVVSLHTYKSFSHAMTALVSHVSDQYIRKSWLAVTRQGLGASLWRGPRPADLVIFLGDMTDRGRWFLSFDRWLALQTRWKALFQGMQLLRHASSLPLRPRLAHDTWPALVIPGNHDTGLPHFQTGEPGPGTARAKSWFEQEHAPFVNEQYVLSESGQTSWNARIPIAVAGQATTHELILLDALDLVSMEPVGHEVPWELAKSNAARTTRLVDMLRQNQTVPRVLFSHVPLERKEAEHACDIPSRSAIHGVHRESSHASARGGDILQGGDAARTYQNLVRKNVSRYVLDSIQPALIFSGDDHDHCEAVHKGIRTAPRGHVAGFDSADAPELTVKSISMLEGVRHPGYAWLQLHAEAPMEYTPCLLPDQVGLWLFVYLPCFIASVMYLTWRRLSLRSSAYLPIHNDTTHAPSKTAMLRRILRDIGHTALIPLLLWLCLQR